MYAGAAVGVSHLVQSTRAGADFGWGLVWAVLLANLIKYPFFELGARYSARTGNSILTGYKEIGSWAVYLFMIVSLITMFIIISAIVVVTGGLLIQVLGLDLDIRWASLIILLISTLILSYEKLSTLNGVIKVIVVLLSITTLIATLSSFSFASQTQALVFDIGDKMHLAFLIALMGWMPAPLDLSVWQSQWYVAKLREENTRTNESDILLDFRIGYIVTIILALLFLSLGKNMFYGKDEVLSATSVGFSSQLIAMYSLTLGPSFKLIISLAALTTMISTTLTCMDAFPRVIRESCLLVFPRTAQFQKRLYLFILALMGLGCALVFFVALNNMRALVDLATILSFLLAPVFAGLNYWAWAKLKEKNSLCLGFRVFSGISLVILIIFSLVYLKTQLI